MGLRYRKSINIGPLRINASKTGLGYSIGTKGLRCTQCANKRKRTTISIPNTGISYVKECDKINNKENKIKTFKIIKTICKVFLDITYFSIMIPILGFVLFIDFINWICKK